MLNALSSWLPTASLTDKTQSVNHYIETKQIIPKVYFRQQLNNVIKQV